MMIACATLMRLLLLATTTTAVVLVHMLGAAPAVAASSGRSTVRIPPALPTQFSADVSIVSHLTDPRQAYPPSVRAMRIQYDFEQQVAKAEILRGHEANKTYVRRYDLKREYMVKHGQFQKCERAYLGEDMPAPKIPFTQEFVGVEYVRGIVCEHWLHQYANVRVHVYSDHDTHVPIRLTEENLVDGLPTMLLTYDLEHVRVGPQDASDFAIPDGYAHGDCARNVGGFPYIHAFHYYVRF